MQRQNINFVRGDDYIVCFRPIPPTDFSGCRFDLQARDDNDDIVLNLSTESGEIEIYPDYIKLDFPHAATQEAEWDKANYDLQLIDSQGFRRTLMMGKIKLIADQTRI